MTTNETAVKNALALLRSGDTDVPAMLEAIAIHYDQLAESWRDRHGFVASTSTVAAAMVRGLWPAIAFMWEQASMRYDND